MKYLGFVLLVLSGNVMSEEVYYCEDYNERSVGFIVNTMNLKTQPRQYLENNIYKTKFQIELQTVWLCFGSAEKSNIIYYTYII